MNVENVRRARDGKVVLSCRTPEALNTVKEKLKSAANLEVTDVRSKQPLVVLKNVWEGSTDDEIQKALRTQNPNIFSGLNEQDSTIKTIFRKKTRNPTVNHIVARVEPLLWQRMTGHGHLYLGMQRIQVADHSPLIQCSMCLGYGHSKRLCKEELPRCSHCGGDHVRAECEKWLAGTVPSCCNCSRARLEDRRHNAFNDKCPIRQRWDALARSTTEYG